MDDEGQEEFFALASEIFPRSKIRLLEKDEVLMAYEGESADPDGRPVGFVHLRPKEGSFYLQGIGVLPDFRHEGLGRELLQIALKKTMAVFGEGGLSLKVRAANAEAVRLYLSTGFSLERFSEKTWTLRWKPLN